MKQHLLYSADAETGSGSNEPVKRLANRYHIPEKDVEALLYGSRAPKSDALGSDIKGKSMAEEFRSNYNAPPRQSGWSPVNVLSAIVGILGIMALTIILISVVQRNNFNRMHSGMMHPPPPMMAPNPPQPAMQDTAARKNTAMNEKTEDVPPPATTNEINTKPAPKAHSYSHSMRHSAPGFSTSNSVEAQEHLAEMRADGNTKAKIHGGTKNGVTIYTVK